VTNEQIASVALDRFRQLTDDVSQMIDGTAEKAETGHTLTQIRVDQIQLRVGVQGFCHIDCVGDYQGRGDV